jgi:predicted dehydrogenase
VNRRGFLKQSAALAGGVALYGAATVGAQNNPPSERIRYALLGCGGMGAGHLDTTLRLKKNGYPVEVVAVCDVYAPRAEAGAQKAGAKAYSDYRRVLERNDIDAVSIASPDHWHVRMTIEAAESGKDVYCEKPMTHWRDLTGATQVVDVISRTKRVMQVGTQGLSDSIWEDIAAKIKAGVIGKLIHVQASDMRNGPIDLYDPRSDDGVAKPGTNLDWGQWLGPAPKRPYHPGRYFAFRSFWDYSGGVGSDFMPHLLTPLAKAMGLDFPKQISAIGGQYAYTGDGREVPDVFNLLIEYPNGPTVYLVAGIANAVSLPTVIRGHSGTVYPRQSPGALIRPELDVAPNAEEIKIERTRGESHEEHFKDDFNCVKSRQKPRSDEQLGLRVMAALNLGIHSYHLGRTIEFKPELIGL